MNALDRYRFESCEEFLETVAETEYLCDGILAAGQPMVIGGPEKSLKTGIMMDLACSLATGGKFLGHFQCSRPVRVGVMSGETDKQKLQRLITTQSKPIGGLSSEVSLWLTQDLPVISDADDLESLRSSIERNELEVLFVDPLYLCLGSASEKTSNVASMGNLLRDFGQIGIDTGCTLALIHHTNRKHEDWRPLELRDLSGAGIAEWCRQWMLLSPRKRFDPCTHQHKLWMVAGGSSGHAGRYAVDVREKNSDEDWGWVTAVRTEVSEKQEYRQEQNERRCGQDQAQTNQFERNMRMALQAHPEGATVNELKLDFKTNHWPHSSKVTGPTMQSLQARGLAKDSTAKRGNNQTMRVWISGGPWATDGIH